MKYPVTEANRTSHKKEPKAKIYHAITSEYLKDSFSECRERLYARWLKGPCKRREQSGFLHDLKESWRKSLHLWKWTFSTTAFLHDRPKQQQYWHCHTSSCLSNNKKSILISSQSYEKTKVFWWIGFPPCEISMRLGIIFIGIRTLEWLNDTAVRSGRMLRQKWISVLLFLLFEDEKN